VPSNAVGEPASEELCGTPGETVDTYYPADARKAHAVLMQVNRPKRPDQGIDKLLDEPRLPAAEAGTRTSGGVSAE